MLEKLNEIIKLANEVKKELKSNKLKNKKLEIKEENGIRYFIYKGIRYDEFKPNKFVSKDILSKEVIDDIVEDKRYLDYDKDVRYNNDIFDSSWENSFIRKILNSTFKEKYLDGLNIDREIRCLTKEEVEELPEDLKETSRYGYWTMSPSVRNADRHATVFFVVPDGSSYSGYVYFTLGVRPVITLSTDELL